MTKNKQNSKPKKTTDKKKSIELIGIKIPQVTTKEFVDNLKPFSYSIFDKRQKTLADFWVS